MTGLSLLEANAITTVLAVGYVASIYVLPGGRLGLGAAGARHRNDPSVIKTRVLAVSVATTVGCLMVVSVVRSHSETIFWQALQNTFNRLGFTSFGPTLAYTITPLLYLGPLYALFLDAELPGQRSWTYQDHVKPLYASWVAIRNYWVGPFTEEVVFRACVLTVYELALPVAKSSRTKLIWLTPFSFGAAHVHHAYETWHRLGKTRKAATQALIQTLVQLAYTTLFGAHCAFLFLRTGSIWPSVTAHVWCNVMGLPQITSEIQRHPNQKIPIIGVYLLGIGAYWYGMRHWTLARMPPYVAPP